MKTRFISAVVALPFLVVPIYLGGIYLLITMLIISFIGFFEFVRAVNKKIDFSNILTSLFLPNLFASVYLHDVMLMLISISLMVLANMIFQVVDHENSTIGKIATNIFSYIYVGLIFSLIYVIRDTDEGLFLVTAIFVCTMMTDVFAYLVGRAMGKKKLAPLLSPNKTVEGSIGGIIASALGLSILGYFFFNSAAVASSSTHIAVLFFVIGCVGSVVAQFGDLFASSVKRETGIKDYGKLIPGHGGIMDRFDSALSVTPLFFALYHITGLI